MTHTPETTSTTPYHPNNLKPFCKKCLDENKECDCLALLNIVIHGWGLSSEALGAYVHLTRPNAEMKDIMNYKGTGKQKYKKIVEELTRSHPIYNKSLINIVNEKPIFNDITQENMIFAKSERWEKIEENRRKLLEQETRIE